MAVVGSPSDTSCENPAGVEPAHLVVVQRQRKPRSLQGLSVSLPETARLILCDNEMLYTESRDGCNSVASATAVLFRPSKMFEKSDRSSARRAYDVCHVFENIGVLQRARYKNLKGYFWLGLQQIPQYLRHRYTGGASSGARIPNDKATEHSSCSSRPPFSNTSQTLKKARKRGECYQLALDPKHTPALSLLTRAYLSSVFSRDEVGVYLSCKAIVSRIMVDQVRKVPRTDEFPPPSVDLAQSSLTQRQVNRRIYDVLGILEVAGVVTKRQKPKAYLIRPQATARSELTSSSDFARKVLEENVRRKRKQEKEKKKAEGNIANAERMDLKNRKRAHTVIVNSEKARPSSSAKMRK